MTSVIVNILTWHRSLSSFWRCLGIILVSRLYAINKTLIVIILTFIIVNCNHFELTSIIINILTLFRNHFSIPMAPFRNHSLFSLWHESSPSRWHSLGIITASWSVVIYCHNVVMTSIIVIILTLFIIHFGIRMSPFRNHLLLAFLHQSSSSSFWHCLGIISISW